MKQPSSKGFTIIELMIAVAILGITVVLAVPAFSGFIERQRVNARAEAISNVLSIARTEAMTRLVPVNVCWNGGNVAITRFGYSLEPGQMAVLPGGGEAVRDITFSDANLFVDDTDDNDCVSFGISGRFDTTSATGGSLVFGVCKESGVTLDSKGVTMNATGRATTVDNDYGATINCT